MPDDILDVALPNLAGQGWTPPKGLRGFIKDLYCYPVAKTIGDILRLFTRQDIKEVFGWFYGGEKMPADLIDSFDQWIFKVSGRHLRLEKNPDPEDVNCPKEDCRSAEENHLRLLLKGHLIEVHGLELTIITGLELDQVQDSWQCTIKILTSGGNYNQACNLLSRTISSICLTLRARYHRGFIANIHLWDPTRGKMRTIVWGAKGPGGRPSQ